MRPLQALLYPCHEVLGLSGLIRLLHSAAVLPSCSPSAVLISSSPTAANDGLSLPSASAASSGSQGVSSQECNTSGQHDTWAARSWITEKYQCQPSAQHQQLRGYASKGKQPAKATVVARPSQLHAPPAFKVNRVPHAPKADVISRLTPEQKTLFQQLNPEGGPLRSLRQLGWPLGQKQVLGLLHDQLGNAAGSNVYVLPFVLENMYQSAASLAAIVKEYLTDGQRMPHVEKFLLTSIANMPAQDIPFDGIKVQVKGRMGSKGGKASKRVWEWGRTSTASISDPVDYAHEAVITRAGYIGIKVWIKFKRSHLAEQVQRSSRSAVSVIQLLSMPAPLALPSRSSSAWWNTPGPLQPQQHKAWECFKAGYNPLSASLSAQQQQQLQQSPQQGSSH